MSTNDIRSIAPEDRKCYFEDEMDLTFYAKYTFINCKLECAILEVETILGCIPWHLPKVIDICCVQNTDHHIKMLPLEKQHKNLWPLDSKRLWDRNDKSSEQKSKALPSLPFWLQPHWLLLLNHLCRVQVLLVKREKDCRFIRTLQAMRLS